VRASSHSNKDILRIIQGSCIEVLKTLPAESINCVMTSPPYWALRDYGTGKWEGGLSECDHKKNPKPLSDKALAKSTIGKASSTGHALEGYKNICGKCGAKRIDKQLGLEPTFQQYINDLCDIFDEVKRVLRKDGTCWVNMGDTYGGTGSKGDYKDPKYKNGRNGQSIALNSKMPSKCLLQIPSRFAIEMTNRGWILRNEIIWHKPNAMPSSAKDRFTVDFEKLFFFTKNKKYLFETQREPHSQVSLNRIKKPWRGKLCDGHSLGGLKNGDMSKMCHPDGRNKRTVWKINTKSYREAHFAVYPPELCETPIKAGCPVGGVVLDPFCGSGTTGLVAKQQCKDFIGIELNPEYIKIAEKRIGSILL